MICDKKKGKLNRGVGETSDERGTSCETNDSRNTQNTKDTEGKATDEVVEPREERR